MARTKASPLALIRMARKMGGITLADVMRTKICTMREALVYVREAEATGRIVRTGGKPGTPFIWRAA